MPPPMVATFVFGFLIALYIVQGPLYRLFNRFVPSRRDNPPIAEFDLVPIESDLAPTDEQGNGLDLIFVHGLGSQPDSTWRAEKRVEVVDLQSGNQQQQKEYVYWINHFLAPDLVSKYRRGIRLFYYNYDSAFYRDASEKRLQDLGDQLLSRITSRRQSLTSEQNRGIVFVGHSYGGLVIKQALLQSQNDQRDEKHSLAVNTRGIIFLGTPHNGSAMTVWSLRLAKFFYFLGSNSTIVMGLLPGCESLKDLQRNFIRAFGHRLYMVNYFEEIKTRLFKWSWMQKDEYIVNRDSATFEVPGTVNDSLRVDHSGLNKFTSRCPEYRNILRRLQRIIESPLRVSFSQETPTNSFIVDYEPIMELVDDLVGRKAELSLIESYLRRKEGQGPRVVTLHGLGGIGKTQLASAYFNKPPQFYSARFRLDGSSRPNFESDFLKIAKAAGLNDASAALSETPIQSIWDWLNLKGNDEWLILLDNVDDPGNSAEQFDDSNFLNNVHQGSVIITTRLRCLAQNSKLVSMGRLESTDALCILQKHAQTDIPEDSDCTNLLEELDGLPLALVISGVFMHQTGASVSSYLDLYKGAWQSLIKSLGNPANYQDRRLETTWLVTYDKIGRQSPAAANLLKLWACLDYRNLDYDLIQDSKSYFKAPCPLSDMVDDKLRFFDAMRDLMGNSFAQSTGRDQWSLHRVLHKWISVTLKEATENSIMQWSVICLGSKAMKRGVPGYWDSSGRLYTHAMRCVDCCVDSVNFESLRRQNSPEEWFDRLLGLARLCIAQKVSLDKARKILAFVITHDTSCLTLSEFPNPLATSEVSLRAMNALGNVYRDQSSYAKAAKTYRRLIEVLDSLDGATRKWLPNICENYVSVTAMGPLQDPWPQISRLRPKTRNFLQLMERIGNADKTFEEKRFGDAAKLFDALRLQLELDSNDRQSIKVWKMAATCYAQRGDYGTASDLFKETLPVALEAKGGYENSMTLDILNNYGVVCRKLGDPEKAQMCFSRAMEHLKSRKGMADGLYLNAAENLGNLLYEMRNYTKAKETFEECLVEAEGRCTDRARQIKSQLRRIEESSRLLATL